MNIKNALSYLFVWADQIISFGQKRDGLVLNYHSVSSDKTIIDITKKEFAKQIKYLSGHYSFVSLDEINNSSNRLSRSQKPRIALTFDDGYLDNLKTVTPILKKNKIPATFFVLSRPENVNRFELANNKPLMTRKHIRKLSFEGFEIGCHTATHADLSKISKSQLIDEIVTAKKELEEVIRKPVRFFAYPKGVYTKESAVICRKAGYAKAFTTDNTNTVFANLETMLTPRIGVDRTLNLMRFKAKLTRFSHPYLVLKFNLFNLKNKVTRNVAQTVTGAEIAFQ